MQNGDFLSYDGNDDNDDDGDVDDDDDDDEEDDKGPSYVGFLYLFP